MRILEEYKGGSVGRLTTITAEDIQALKEMIVHHAGIEHAARYLVENFPKRCEQLVGWSLLDALGNDRNKIQVLTERLKKLLIEASGLTE